MSKISANPSNLVLQVSVILSSNLFLLLDAILEVSEPHYYAVFGSGIKGVGPRIPLWTAPASDLTNWTFLGALWEPEANSSIGPPLSTHTYAFNFEVSGFFELKE